jgi:nucleotide-binding universal stress UspA family protein
MTFKDILVHVDNLEPSAARLSSAINLAESLDARLTGLYVVQKPYLPAYAEAQISADILEEQAEIAKQQAEEAGKKFAEATGKNGLQSEWRVEEGTTAEVFTRQARYHDLAIVGQGHPDSYFFIGDREMPDRMIMTSGRPALVIPYVGEYATIGKRVMVAWDAGPMAARAVHDALPLLQTAKNVTVMVVNPKNGSNGTGDIPGADISAHLARHGVNAQADHVKSDMDTGNMLLSRAADMGADLIVMGAYGHARWAELVLGGVTDHMLKHMTAPVLMSH